MKKIKVIILMIIMCFVFVAPLKTVDAADYISNEFNGNHIFTSYDKMYSEGKNLVIIQTDDDCGPNEKGEYYNKIIIDSITESGNVNKKEFNCENARTYAIKKEKSNIYTCNRKSNYKVIVQKRGLKGKIKASYPIRVNKKEYKITTLNDIMIKGKKMYCVLDVIDKKSKKENTLIQCYDMRKKEVISSKKIKEKGYFFYENNRLLGYSDNKINVYTLIGKKLSSKKLPKGETVVIGHLTHLNNVAYEYTFKGVDVNNGYIYYCNRNGIYRCNVNGNQEFSLIYSGANDSLFNPEYGEERMLEHFKVLDNGDFYMIVDNYEHSKTAAYIYKQAESLGF